jgi:hypothetical protein
MDDATYTKLLAELKKISDELHAKDAEIARLKGEVGRLLALVCEYDRGLARIEKEVT